jgi:hypothetical protein
MTTFWAICTWWWRGANKANCLTFTPIPAKVVRAEKHRFTASLMMIDLVMVMGLLY